MVTWWNGKISWLHPRSDLTSAVDIYVEARDCYENSTTLAPDIGSLNIAITYLKR